MNTLILSVTGMTCQGCVKGVQLALSALPSVQNIQVSLEQAQVSLDYDGTQVSKEQIIDTIENKGFDVNS